MLGKLQVDIKDRRDEVQTKSIYNLFSKRCKKVVVISPY